MKFDHKKQTRNIDLPYGENFFFDILNRLGVDHKCDGRRDRQTERPLAIAHSNSTRYALKAIFSKQQQWRRQQLRH